MRRMPATVACESKADRVALTTPPLSRNAWTMLKLAFSAVSAHVVFVGSVSPWQVLPGDNDVSVADPMLAR